MNRWKHPVNTSSSLVVLLAPLPYWHFRPSHNQSLTPSQYAAAFLAAGGGVVIPDLVARSTRFRQTLRDGECNRNPQSSPRHLPGALNLASLPSAPCPLHSYLPFSITQAPSLLPPLRLIPAPSDPTLPAC